MLEPWNAESTAFAMRALEEMGLEVLWCWSWFTAELEYLFIYLLFIVQIWGWKQGPSYVATHPVLSQICILRGGVAKSLNYPDWSEISVLPPPPRGAGFTGMCVSAWDHTVIIIVVIIIIIIMVIIIIIIVYHFSLPTNF